MTIKTPALLIEKLVRRKDYFPLLLIISVFVLLKIPHLSYAYYWDECSPYAVAIDAMFRHGVTLSPAGLDPELSRGHPLFFHCIAALWMNVFGGSHISMHSFALFISALLLIVVYAVALQLFNLRVALMAVVLIAGQEMFFVQSSMVLLEVLLALLCFLSLFFYCTDRYVFTALSLSMLFYTKESGLVLGCVLGLHAAIGLVYQKITFATRIFRLLSVVLPVIFIAAFFIIQHRIRGWYIFPFHTDLIQHSWQGFWYVFRMSCIATLFQGGYRFVYFLPLLVLSGIIATKKRDVSYPVILLPAICLWYFVDDMRAGRLLPSVPFFFTFILSVAAFIYYYSRPFFFPSAPQRRMVILASTFVVLFLVFSALNFFTPRYLLAALIPMLLLLAAWLDALIVKTKRSFYYALLVLLPFVTYGAYTTSSKAGDVNIGAFDGLKVQQDVVVYFEKFVPHADSIATGSFLTAQHLSNPATGFLKAESFVNVSWNIDNNTKYVIFDNIETDKRYNSVKNNPAFRLVYSIRKSEVWAEVYKKVASF